MSVALENAKYHRLTAETLEACCQYDGSCEVPYGMRVQYLSRQGRWKNTKMRSDWLLKISRKKAPEGNLYLRLVAKPSKRKASH